MQHKSPAEVSEQDHSKVERKETSGCSTFSEGRQKPSFISWFFSFIAPYTQRVRALFILYILDLQHLSSFSSPSLSYFPPMLPPAGNQEYGLQATLAEIGIFKSEKWTVQQIAAADHQHVCKPD